MRDVARRAGVSTATVSFVVNGTKRVAPHTRERVTAAMDELGFRQNRLAVALASRHTRIIALLSPALEHHLGRAGMAIITTAAQTARERGYRLVLWPVSNDAHEMTELVTDGLLDGVLLMEVEVDDRRVEKLTELGAKFALIGRTRDPSGFAYVDIDFDKAIADGLEHLVGLGHTRIALVMGEAAGAHLPGYGPRVRVEEAFRAGMTSRGLAPIVTSAEPTSRGGAAAVDELLLTTPGVTAIIVSNEDAAPGIVRRLEELGRPIPKSVSVLSIANLPALGETTSPVLTTLNVPQVGLGERAVVALIDQIEGTSTKLPQTLLPCVLQIEETTGPAPALQN
jgi:DNA-binding LacI/PurR family transcriptional regulator